jgi:hypothetical protein
LPHILCKDKAWKHQKDEWKKIVTQTDLDMEPFKDIIDDASALKRKLKAEVKIKMELKVSIQ